MRVIALAAVCGLAAACSNQTSEAERKYRMAERAGESPAELCQRAREVAEAYLNANRDLEYRTWSATAGLKCNQALLDGLAP
jgi:hypothetical protein